MKKEDTISLVVYVLMIAIAILVGFLVIQPLFSTYGYYLPGNGKANILIAFLVVVLSIIFNVVIFEVAHVIGAKIGGYQILSFNILGLCWYRKSEKGFKFKFSNFDGLTGETKIAPKRDNASPKAFALLPLLAYILEFVIGMIIFYVITGKLKASDKNGALVILPIIAMMNIAVGSMLELYNIFPAHLDSTTDGYRLVILSKKENLKAYNELMRIEAALQENKELNNMIVFDDITDFTAEVNLYSVYKLFKEKNFFEAEAILDKILSCKNKISRTTYCSVLAQKMYLVLMNKSVDESKEFASKYLTTAERRYIASDLSMQSIRAYLLIAAIIDASEHEARYIISREKRALKRTLPGRVEIEKAFYEEALNKVDSIYPEWKIKEPRVN